MTQRNAYCNLAELQAHLPNSGGYDVTLLDQAIEGAARAIDRATGRKFFPSVQSLRFDIDAYWYPRELLLPHTLEVFSLTNGDGTSIASTEYMLYPLNLYPKTRLVVKKGSTVRLLANDTTGYEGAIGMTALCGWARDYTLAWASTTTLSAAISTTTATALSVGTSSGIAAGDIVRVGDELMHVTATAGSALTVERGWNGSTAITHSNSTAVKVWRVEPDVKRANLILAARYFRRGETVYGTTGGGDMGVQPVIIPTLDPDVSAILANLTEWF